MNGLNAQYVLAVSAGNRVAGMRLAAGGGVSSIAFMADQIGFTNGAGTVYPLSVVDGVVRATNFEADRVKANSIVADSIVGGAVSSLTTNASYAGVGIGGGNSVLGHGHTSTGGQHVVNVACTVAQTGGGVSGVLAVLYCNGQEIGRGSTSFSGPFSQTIPIIALHTPGAGFASYEVVCSQTGGSTGTNVHGQSTIVTIELKK